MVRLGAVLAVLGLLIALFLLVWRPRSQRWGATSEETRRVMPGDEVASGAMRSTETRAITIQAPVAHVWPWLAQLGQDRGGFYSYRLLENLAGCKMPDADRIHPEMQSWKPGDKLWMYPADRAGGVGCADLLVHEPGRALVFGTRRIGTPPSGPHDGTWSFVVEPIRDTETRLLIRGRADKAPALMAALELFVFEPAHFVMERKTMSTIKARAEGFGPTPWADAVEVVSWTLLVLMLVASAVLALRGRPLGRALTSMFAAGVLFQILTFTGPGPVPSIVAVVLVALLVPWRRTVRQQILKRLSQRALRQHTT